MFLEFFVLKINILVGIVLYIVDWKIDVNFIIGLFFDVSFYKWLGSENIFVMVGDFINVIKLGFLILERNCYDGLLNIIVLLKGRVVVGCFGSNIVWLILLVKVVKKIKCYMVLYGCLLMNMYGIVK